MGFEWKTDDDQTQPSAWREEKRSRRVHPARWRWYLLLLVAAIAAGVYLWRLGQQRVEESLERARADVRVSHELVERAAAASDVELARTILSGRDEDWTAVQRNLVADGLGHTGVARLLLLQPAGPAEEVSLAFDPAMRSAELVVAQPYTPVLAAETAGPVVLEQTFVFRRGSNSWLLSPPDEEFWGQQHSLSTDLAAFHFPARDRELARDLALDLERDVVALCARFRESCPQDLQLTITFDVGVESLAHFQNGREMMRNASEISIPAPTLLGKPQDEAGYEALHAAYARYLLTAVAPQITGWECCAHVLFWQALLQTTLQEMGLAEPLLPEADTLAAMEQAAGGHTYFQTLTRYWQGQTPAPVTEPLPLEVRTLVAFLLELPPSSARQGVPTLAELQTALGEEPSLGRWWSAFTRFGSQEQVELQRELYSFVQGRYTPRPLPAGLALPNADLLLVCLTEGARVSRYDLHAEGWTIDVDLPTGLVFALLTSGDSYLVAAARGLDDEQLPVFHLLEKPPGSPAVELIAESGAMWIPLRKRGDTIPVVHFPVAEGGEQVEVGMLDLGSCRSGECQWQDTPGIVTTSPDGRYELAFSVPFIDEPELFLREQGAEWQKVAEGANPVWLDGETFAYLQAQQGSGFKRVMVQDTAGNAALLFDGDAQTGTQLGGTAVMLRQLSTSAAAPDRLFLVASAGNEFPAVYVLSISRPAAGSWLVTAPVLPEILHKTEGLARFSGSSVLADESTERWLLTMLDGSGFQPAPAYWLVDTAGEHPPLTLHTVSDEWFSFGTSYDWSPDGQWLAWSVGGGISIIAPAYREAGEPYRLFIPTEAGSCGLPTWVERN